MFTFFLFTYYESFDHFVLISEFILFFSLARFYSYIGFIILSLILCFFSMLISSTKMCLFSFGLSSRTFFHTVFSIWIFAYFHTFFFFFVLFCLSFLKQSWFLRFEIRFSLSHFTYAAYAMSFIFLALITMDISGKFFKVEILGDHPQRFQCLLYFFQIFSTLLKFM